MRRRIVFFGTPAWAVPSLQALHDSSWEIAGVVTNPDRPAGRGLRLVAPPVKDRATDLGYDIFQPPSARSTEMAGWLTERAPDVAIVVAYGKILPGALLDIPPLGFLNVHFSLLPAYRGAAPVQRAVMDGAPETGVSIMRLTEGMDEGPVLAIETVTVDPDRTAGEIGEELANIGAELLTRTLDGYASGDISPVEQDHTAATYAPKISSEESAIAWDKPADEIRRLVHGLSPFPGAWTMLGDKRFKLYRVEPSTGAASLAAGTLSVVDGELVAGTADGALRIVEAQMAGKRRMMGTEIARGLDLSGPISMGGSAE